MERRNITRNINGIPFHTRVPFFFFTSITLKLTLIHEKKDVISKFRRQNLTFRI